MGIRYLLSISYFIFFSVSSSLAARESQVPNGFVLPVRKDAPSGQYITRLHQRTPLVPISLTVDLGGESIWVNCINKNFSSSTYAPIPCTKITDSCGCSPCDGPPRVGCHNMSCRLYTPNPIRDYMHSGIFEIYKDILAVQSVGDDGRNPGPVVGVKRFKFVCVADQDSMFDDLPKGVQGMAGLGNGSLGLPYQLANTYKLPVIFSLCLSSSSSNGVIFVGDVSLPGLNASKSLMYTPLLYKSFVASSYYRGTVKTEYYIGVKAIKVNNKTLPINTALLSFDYDSGIGGTQISTIQNFTLLETSIFNVFVKAFERELQHVSKVEPSPPFKICYSARSLHSTPVGPAVPTIDFVMQNDDVFWRVFGRNSMVRVGKDKLCLAFLDGGPIDRVFGRTLLPPVMDTGIVIGGYQLEDNLLRFDIANSRLGFSSSLLSKQTKCGNFNFNFTSPS